MRECFPKIVTGDEGSQRGQGNKPDKGVFQKRCRSDPPGDIKRARSKSETLAMEAFLHPPYATDWLRATSSSFPGLLNYLLSVKGNPPPKGAAVSQQQPIFMVAGEAYTAQ